MRHEDIDRIKDQIARFCVADERGCWVWQRSTRGEGYSQMTLSGRRQVNGSRAAYFAFVGEIPAGMLVCHECDNRRCCNPNHLFLGTHKDNSQDCVAKGRLRPGRTGGIKKLSPQNIDAIKAMRMRGALQRQIAAVFGVSQVRVSQILKGKHGNRSAH